MKLRGGLIAIVLSALVGCGNDAPNVITLMAHGDCKRLSAGVSDVRFEDLAGIRGSQLLGVEDATPTAAPPPEPGFRLIAISAGARPTPGYSLELGGARFDAGVLVLTITLNEPPLDARLVQVTSHPCLIIATSQQRVPIEVRTSEGVLGSLPPISEPVGQPTSQPVDRPSGQ